MSVFRYQDKSVFYLFDDKQHAKTLVILNGIMMSHKSWEVFLPAFLADMNVLRLDFLDQGLSDKMQSGYTQAIQVDLLKGLLDALSLEKVHLMGISYGGSVALQFAAKHQDRLESLLLFNVAAYTTPWLRDIGRGWNRVAATRDGEMYYHITIPYIYSPQFYQKRQDWMEQRKAKLVPLFSDPAFLDAMIRLTNSAETHDVRQALPTITTKTLIVASEQDYLTPLHEQKAIAETMPNADLVVFPSCGHASMYEKPRLFVTTVKGFVLENDGDYTI